jgi:hypothetical protein
MATWCRDSGCDALVLRFETYAPASYAADWLSATEGGDPARFQRELETWVGYLRSEGIEAVSAGLVTLRRVGSRAPWFRAHDAPERLVGPGGEHLLRAFAAHDFLAAARGDAALLEARLRVAPEGLEQVCESDGRGWQLGSATLRLDRGLAYSGSVEPLMAELVARCDGARTLRELLKEVSPDWQANPDAVAAAALPGVRVLIERGFLLPSLAPS